jgi:3-hydroxyacyl-[acyl-carrier-protein] dehydratase
VWNVEKIMQYLPHRYPVLLVDRIIELEPMKRSVGLKNVTINEGFFQGHYPGLPVMPGVLIIEAMAQTGACMILGDESCKGFFPFIGAIDDVRFRRPVVPGDTLITHCDLLWFRNQIGRIKAECKVGEEAVASMELTFKLLKMEL